MATERTTRWYRKLYATLLRLYPETFRSRFAESMEQTFHDLCRERHTSGRGLFSFALGLFAETFAGILRERIALIMPRRKNIIRLALITASILSVPLKTREKVIGVRRLYTGAPRDFTANDIDLATALAHLGSLAIQNASLYLMCQTDLKDLQDELWSHRSWF